MADIRYTAAFQRRLEDIFAESPYHLRYEKGQFRAGYCVLKEQKLILVNKFYSLEGKINCLLDILRTLPLDAAALSDKNARLYADLTHQP